MLLGHRDGKFLTNEQIDFLQNALNNAKKVNDDALKTIEMQKKEIDRLNDLIKSRIN